MSDLQDTDLQNNDWFWNALDTESQRGTVEVDTADINYLTWSEPGAQGLLLVPGHNAHAHWWDHIAPFYKDDYQTVAIDLSGMGDSDHRDAYSADIYAKEIIAVADDCGLPENTLLISHSFGGLMSIKAMVAQPGRFKGLVLLDAGPKDPGEALPPVLARLSRARLYPTQKAALARFRLQPPQQSEHQFIIEHIARHSIEYLEGEGFAWKFDEEQQNRMQSIDTLREDFQSIKNPCALIYGTRSELFSTQRAAYMQDLLPHLEVTSLGGAGHHLFLDRPFEFMALLSKQLASWGLRVPLHLGI